MHIDSLILYAPHGQQRQIDFRPGALNVITGDSRTGKSSLINIIRFLLGSGSPHVPAGPIQRSVAWYGLLAHIGETRFFVGRPAPEGDETNATMLLIGVEDPPPLSELSENTTSDALREYIGGLIGIEDNLNVPEPGRTRAPLSANLVHALYYCFQGQGEIANPDILFHRQNREWQPQAIRDTLPFFLGAQGAEDMRKRQELTEVRRDLRRAQQQLRAAEAERESGLDRAGSLLSEARDVGIGVPDDTAETLDEARAQLRALVDERTSDLPQADAGVEFETLNRERRAVADQIRELGEQLRGLDDFAQAGDAYTGELDEQRARLASIGLVPEGADGEATCALCGQALGDQHSGAHERVTRALASLDRRLELAQRDIPRIETARRGLVEQRRDLRRHLAEINQALDSIAANNEVAAQRRESLNLQSYVRGRIAQYLDTTQIVEDEQLAQLTQRVADLRGAVERLEDELDPEAIRSRTISLLNTVSRQMSEWAKELGLEHAQQGPRIDYDRLTIVVDTDDGPAYMDRGEIGSGMNWVGYHLTAYLSLQEFFIRHERPVPRFVVFDQPSQAFFPPDRESGGDLDELDDTDREHTRQLYELMQEVVTALDGQLQVMALDHADFEDQWFQEAVIQRWRGGEALIPTSWITPGDPTA